jgi:hypothetical protein
VATPRQNAEGFAKRLLEMTASATKAGKVMEIVERDRKGIQRLEQAYRDLYYRWYFVTCHRYHVLMCSELGIDDHTPETAFYHPHDPRKPQ